MLKNATSMTQVARSMNRIMGVDPSTKTGVVVLDGDTGSVIQAAVVSFKETKAYTRLHLLEKSMKSLLIEHEPKVIVIEGYNYRNKFSLVTMVEIGTIFRLAFHSAGHRWYDVPPTTLKKITTGSGAADKDKMAVAVKQKWGFVSDSDDVVDAYALAQVGRTIAMSGVDLSLKGVCCNEK